MATDQGSKCLADGELEALGLVRIGRIIAVIGIERYTERESKQSEGSLPLHRDAG